MKGILVIGHGSRSRDALDVFNRIVDDFRARMESCVEGCFMELSEPNIPDTVEVRNW